MQLKDRLRELRGRRTQREIIDEFNAKYDIKLRQNNYSNWENGKEPNIQTLILLADFHGVTLDYLLGRVDYADASFESVCLETGLTERAIKGLHALQQSSKQGHVNIFKVLIYLLESELEEDCQNNLKIIQGKSDPFFWYELKEHLIPSLSTILMYIAGVSTRDIETNCAKEAKKIFDHNDYVRINNMIEYANRYVEQTIPYKILSSLRDKVQKYI